MSRSWLALLIASMGATFSGCGAVDNSTLFGNSGGGAGGSTELGAGGAISSGGSVIGGGGSGGHSLGSGGADSVESGGASTDSGVPPGGGGDMGTGGTVGVGGSTESGGAPGGPWGRCASDNDCTDNRVCTASAQSILAAGRPGACVHHCGLDTSTCDAPPAAGKVTCTQLLVDSFCTITCPNGSLCPAGMECVSGICYYSK